MSSIKYEPSKNTLPRKVLEDIIPTKGDERKPLEHGDGPSLPRIMQSAFSIFRSTALLALWPACFLGLAEIDGRINGIYTGGVLSILMVTCMLLSFFSVRKIFGDVGGSIPFGPFAILEILCLNFATLIYFLIYGFFYFASIPIVIIIAFGGPDLFSALINDFDVVVFFVFFLAAKPLVNYYDDQGTLKR